MNYLINITRGLVISTLCLGLYSCQQNLETSGTNSAEVQLFEVLNSDRTGIEFANQLTETPELNMFLYDAFFYGSGVGVGDFDKDGREDIYFASNMKGDQLYFNKGDMRFEDVTESTGIGSTTGWSTGVAVADVNGDSWLDIYVCKFLYSEPDSLLNKLYVNNGDGTFSEKAEEYGIAGPDFSMTATFFDYDLDGDLDLYVGNQPPNSHGVRASQQIDYRFTDRLYRNDGNETFTDVTNESGVRNYNYSLGLAVGDVNNDGWPDLYVASDYDEPDYLWQNNGDGTFSNKIHEYIRHISNFSMGVEVSDINNDGWMDIYSADMVADNNKRLKTNMSGMNPEKFWAMSKAGYHQQYMFNALQLNNGNGTFSEIAQMCDVANTDWSWSTYFIDVDNDGLKDLFVSNGIMRDMMDNDFIRFLEKRTAEARAQGIPVSFNMEELNQQVPSVKLNNYIFHNRGNYEFKRMMNTWGMDIGGWTNGAAYADFDNDGDLDMVTNNVNDKTWIYMNTCEDKRLNNWIRIQPVGEGANHYGIGTRVCVETGDNKQYFELFPNKGYMSSNAFYHHFGIGDNEVVDQITVTWPDGRENILQNIRANQVLEVRQADASGKRDPLDLTAPIFSDISGKTGFDYTHQENNFDDYAREILIPHRMSHLGPSLASADVNGDGLEDIFIGGPSGQSGALYLQEPGKTFKLTTNMPWDRDEGYEDVGALFFDADGDNDADLYVVSGGNDFDPNSEYLQDRLYINDGNGQFKKANGALPRMITSGSKARSADYDGDGDLDLFVGGRQIPGQYGFPAKSYILRNEGGRFIDITDNIAPDFAELGMVTDAVWNDLDGDNNPDLVIVGEWMPITVYRNDGENFTNATSDYGLDNTEGWWNTIKAADMDQDGDMDFIAGNLGLNIKYKASPEEPFKLYVKDFDENGSNDVYLGYYDHDGVCYPVRGRTCSSQQLPYIKKKFKTYLEFGQASIEEVLGSRMEGAIYHEAKQFNSVFIRNDEGSMTLNPLPKEAQISPVFGIVVVDVNQDGNPDLITAGNYYEREVETTRSDAGIGQILLGNGKGGFTAMHPTKTGLKAYLDVRDIALINDNNGVPILFIANNNTQPQVFAMNGKSPI